MAWPVPDRMIPAQPRPAFAFWTRIAYIGPIPSPKVHPDHGDGVVRHRPARRERRSRNREAARVRAPGRHRPAGRARVPRGAHPRGAEGPARRHRRLRARAAHALRPDLALDQRARRQGLRRDDQCRQGPARRSSPRPTPSTGPRSSPSRSRATAPANGCCAWRPPAGTTTTAAPRSSASTSRDADRGTLCVSSQVGCTLTCSFCHTGTQRLVRNLTAAEIAAQLVVARDRLGDWAGQNPADAPARTRPGAAVTNIVFMGMGEPLYNLDNVVDAVGVMATRRASASRAGASRSRPPASCRRCSALGDEAHAMLAISLHAVRDDLRDDARAPQPQVSDRRAARRLPRLSGPQQRPAHHLRIRDAEGRQRHRRRCARAGAPAQGHPGQDQPDPVQSLAGQRLRMLGLGADRALLGDRLPSRLRLARSARRAAATSWPPAASSRARPRSCAPAPG